MDTGLRGLSEAPISLQRGVWRTAFKRQAEHRKSNGTLRNDLDLSLPVEANASYAFRCLIFGNALDGGILSMSCLFSVPSGASFVGMSEPTISGFGSITRSLMTGYASSFTFASVQSNAASILRGFGVLRTVAAGMVTFRYAQVGSTPARYQILPGSSFQLMRCSL